MEIENLDLGTMIVASIVECFSFRFRLVNQSSIDKVESSGQST